MLNLLQIQIILPIPDLHTQLRLRMLRVSWRKTENRSSTVMITMLTADKIPDTLVQCRQVCELRWIIHTDKHQMCVTVSLLPFTFMGIKTRLKMIFSDSSSQFTKQLRGTVKYITSCWLRLCAALGHTHNWSATERISHIADCWLRKATNLTIPPVPRFSPLYRDGWPVSSSDRL
jgi:hypothetical protein